MGNFYIALAGFLISFVLLFYFISMYREACAAPAPLPSAGPSGSPASIVVETEQELKGINQDINVFRSRIKEMENLLSSRKELHEQQIGEIISNINMIVEQLDKVEPEKAMALHSEIQSLITSLENLRGPWTGAKPR